MTTIAPSSVSDHSATPSDLQALPYQVLGKTLDKLPKDLYIPPQALHVLLETFQGPLDLLLYLIKKQNLDIMDIPIVEITRQYIAYIDLMQAMHFELAAEYMLMAAMLAEIKSRMLLPRPPSSEEDEDLDIDPRAELVRRLQEYERFKQASEVIAALPLYERDTFPALASGPDLSHYIPLQPQIAMDEILKAMAQVMQRARMNQKHTIKFEQLSVRERMSQVLQQASAQRFVAFGELFTLEEGTVGVVVTLLAILELWRQASLEIVQSAAFAAIYVRVKGSVEHE